jgi:predicted SprT family Zn-dependent metalloprotease
MQAKMEAVRNKVKQCIESAEQIYGVKMPVVDIRFDLTGRAAGMAGWRHGGFGRMYFLRFNVTHMSLGGKSWEHLLNDTVPHEVAHTVCQAFPKFGRNHDAGWKRVCVALGGNGKRCYSVEDAPEAIAKQRPFTYTTSTGQTVAVSIRIHNKIQKGSVYSYRNGLGVINRNSPVTKTAVKAPKMTTLTIENTKEKTVAKTVVKKTAKVSNAQRMRDFIATGKSYAECVEFGMNELGQKKPLATQYVKVLWVKAGRKDPIA